MKSGISVGGSGGSGGMSAWLEPLRASISASVGIPFATDTPDCPASVAADTCGWALASTGSAALSAALSRSPSPVAGAEATTGGNSGVFEKISTAGGSSLGAIDAFNGEGVKVGAAPPIGLP